MPASPDERSWVLPGEPVPVRLMNTVWADTAGIHDDLSTTRDLAEWFAAVAANGDTPRASKVDLTRARQLRDALRRLAAHLTDDDRAAAATTGASFDEAIDTVNSCAADLPAPRLTITRGDLAHDSAAGSSPTAALAQVATMAIDLLGGPSSAELRACHAPGCVLYFVRTHPRRAWCSDACGNRARAARHYQKVRAER
jgi:predicted RNA-binding Zn ribbon-like protein